jgi:hypothetical protein
MVKITGLPADTSPSTDDITITVDTTSGQAKKLLLSDLITLINASGTPLSSNFNNPYKFSAYRNAALTMTSSVVAYDAEHFDTNSNFDITTNKGRYTVPVDGFYQFNAAVMANVGSGSHYIAEFWKNGSAVKRFYEYTAGASTNWTFSGATMLQLVAGDYIEILFSPPGSTGIFVGAAYTWFNGFLVSKT